MKYPSKSRIIEYLNFSLHIMREMKRIEFVSENGRIVVPADHRFIGFCSNMYVYLYKKPMPNTHDEQVKISNEYDLFKRFIEDYIAPFRTNGKSSLYWFKNYSERICTAETLLRALNSIDPNSDEIPEDFKRIVLSSVSPYDITFPHFPIS